MFSPLSDSRPFDRRSARLLGSVSAHLLLLAWLVHSPTPVFVSPTFVRQGQRGTSLSSVYYPGEPQVSRAHLPSKTYLTLNHPLKKSSTYVKPDSKLESDSLKNEATLLPNERPAGSPYGSLSYGTLSGPDVRPALPVFSPDPAVDVSEVPGGEGDVIIEVTIDDQGNVVQEIVLHGLSPSIDQRVLSAVARWHFRPATRNSVPMASKQDVYYHFPH